MKYNKRFWNPILVAIPDFGIGAFWALNGTIIPWIAYLFVKQSFLVGLMLSMGAFTGCFVQILSGIISDRTRSCWGRRTPWVIFGAAAAALSVVSWSFAPNYWTLFILSFVTYFFINFFQGPYYSLVMEAVDRDQVPYANTLARTTAQIGGTCVSFVSAWLWSYGLLTSTVVIALIIILPVILIVPGILKEDQSEHCFETKFAISLDFLKFPRVNQLFVSVFFVYAAYAVLVPMMTPYFVHHLHFSHQNIATALTIYSFAGIVFGVLSGRLVAKFHRKLIYIVSMGLFALAMFMGIFVHSSPAALYTFVAIAGIGYLSTQINMYSLLSEISPAARLGEFVGIMNLFISASQFIIMNVMAWWLDHGGAQYLYITAFSMLLVSILVMIPNIKPRRVAHGKGYTLKDSEDLVSD